MKKSIIVPIDSDRLTALKMYLAQKNLHIEVELEKYADELYKKYVPQNVRDYIAMTAQNSAENKPKKPAAIKQNTVPAADKPTETP